MPTSELPAYANTESVHLSRFTFILSRSISVSLDAESLQYAQVLFRIVFGEHLYSQIKSIY